VFLQFLGVGGHWFGGVGCWCLSGKSGNLVGASLANRNITKYGVILKRFGWIGAISEPLAWDFGKGESLLRSVFVCAGHHYCGGVVFHHGEILPYPVFLCQKNLSEYFGSHSKPHAKFIKNILDSFGKGTIYHGGVLTSFAGILVRFRPLNINTSFALLLEHFIQLVKRIILTDSKPPMYNHSSNTAPLPVSSRLFAEGSLF
jgi:hypothetical protein